MLTMQQRRTTDYIHTQHTFDMIDSRLTINGGSARRKAAPDEDWIPLPTPTLTLHTRRASKHIKTYQDIAALNSFKKKNQVSTQSVQETLRKEYVKVDGTLPKGPTLRSQPE
jgi:hypothetical protein